MIPPTKQHLFPRFANEVSKLLTTGLMEAGYDVKISEIHGMSQR